MPGLTGLTCNLPGCGRPLQSLAEFDAGLCSACQGEPRRQAVEIRVAGGLLVPVRPMLRDRLDGSTPVEFWRAFHPRRRGMHQDGATPAAAVRALGLTPEAAA
jgi:hypothetical protein